MGRNPGSRTDDYHSAIFRKMNEAIDEAISRNVDAIVHGGDWFNHPKVSNIIYNQHQRMLQKARDNDIPVYCVPGNHDLFGYSMATIDQTSIGSLAEAQLITLLTRDTPVVLTGADGVTVALYGREYSVDIDHDPVNDYQIKPIKSKNKKAIQSHILFSHGMLLDKPFHPDVRHTLTKDVVTDADYVFNGHYHPGWPTHEINGVTFVNNGSTGRNEGSVGNLTFVPQYTIIEMDGFSETITPVDYACAAAGKDIFDRTQLVQQKQYVQHLESFEQTLQDSLAYESFNPKDIILKTKATRKLPQSILDETLAAIVEQEQLTQDSKLDNYVASKTPVQIEWIELVNFEAHKKTRIDFNKKGLNAITGASDSGKSAIIRGLRFAFYNEPKGADFIRHGATRATVRVGMSTGHIIERGRTKSSSGEYIITDPKGNQETFKGFGNAIPAQVQNAHQMPKVELAVGNERPLNFAYQLDGHFLLSDSPAQRASAIGRLTGVHLVDAAIKEKTKEMRAITIETNAAEQMVEELTETLTKYEWIDDKEKYLRSIEGLILGAEKDEEEIAQLEALAEERADIRANINEYKAVVAELSYIDDVEKLIVNATQLDREITDAKELLELAEGFEEAIARYQSKSNLYDLVAIEKGLESSSTIDAEIDVLMGLHAELESSERNVARAEKSISNYPIEEIEKRLSDVEAIEVELDTLSAMKKEYVTAESDYIFAERELINANDALAEIERKMDELIDSMGATCPLCNQSITDKDLIKHGHGEAI